MIFVNDINFSYFFFENNIRYWFDFDFLVMLDDINNDITLFNESFTIGDTWEAIPFVTREEGVQCTVMFGSEPFTCHSG